MGDSHTFVYPEAPYYNSHCLNKDIPALIAFAGRETAPLMSAVDEINKYKKNEIE
jgi:UDP-glucose 6-dehydrogenase